MDNWHVISADNPAAGVFDVAGVASQVGYSGWKIMGSVCFPSKKHRVGVTEFWGNPNDWEGGKLKAALVNIPLIGFPALFYFCKIFWDYLGNIGNS